MASIVVPVFDLRGSKTMPYTESENDDGCCIPLSLLAPAALAEEI